MGINNKRQGDKTFGDSKSLVIEDSLDSYFADQVREAILDTSIEISSDVEFYLVHILSNYALQSNMKSSFDEKPLAILFMKAANKSKREQIEIYRNLGDGTLYVSGFFGQSFSNSIVDIEYYTDLGCRSYLRLADLFRIERGSEQFSVLYNELACKFEDLVEILTVISEQADAAGSQKNPVSLMRLYERWEKTKSSRLVDELNKMGIYPVNGNKGGIH